MYAYVMDRTRYTFFINAEQRAGLQTIKERDGISESEQIRRAIDEWLAKRGGAAKAATTRRQPARRRS
jgi:hypothetical protein